MEKKRKIYLILMLVFAALLFVWIGVALALSGDGSLGLGPNGDRRIFRGFLAAELATLAALFFFAGRVGKLNAASGRAPKRPKLSPAEKRQRRRTTLLFVLGAALSYAAELLGIAALRGTAENRTPVILALALLLLCAVLNLLLPRARGRSLERRRAEEGDAFLLAEREKAAETVEEKLRLLRRLRLGSLAYAAALLLIALAGSFWLGGLHKPETLIWLWWLFAAFAGAATARLPLPVWEDGQPVRGRLEKAAFPVLYSLCERAAEAVGCREKLTLCVIGGSEVLAADRGDECLISLGADALLILTEEELYQLLLHAFVPIADRRTRRENRYYHWLQTGRDAYFLGWLSQAIFRYPDAEYDLQFKLCSYAASLCATETTMRVLRQLTDPAAAASAWLRTRYFELWNWERENADRRPTDTYDQLLHELAEERPEAFRRELPLRRAFWDGLIEKEQLGEGWSGTTLREQFRSLGVDNPALAEYRVSPACREEILRAAGLVDDGESRKRYEDDQTEARATLEAWEADGRPLRPRDYGEVISAMRVRGRLREALALCERAIEELPDTASIDYPCFFKGCWLLHEWDARGLQFVYRAMDGNGNYIDNGLNTIAGYCRLSGDREALKHFEERAPALQRRHEEEDSELGVLRRTDDLRGESLPEALKEDLLNAILDIGGEEILRIYLVHKTVTPTRATSAMVVEFEPETPPERTLEIMRRIFIVLDDSTDHQFSLFQLDEVRPVQVERIEGSLFYEKKQ